ncbi:MAG: PQQ-binding-like beta-propeller repeat protein [Planctomycetes bacterium]|nr:PQQ-binding-like beta-propeller repeat protein [Planctomycetota bacterium]
MAFRGDASQIPLTNIVQTLNLNRQDGILTISAAKMRRRIFFQNDGVRPVASARDDLELLETALAKLKIATPAQFRNLIATRTGDPPYAGDFLVERHIVTPEEVSGRIARQLRESILDIFWWPNARYEFTLGAPAPEQELFDPEGLGRSITLPVSSILMEVARRQDEWSLIRQSVPSDLEVFQLDPDATVPADPPEGLSSEEVREVVDAMDGERNVRAIVAATTLSGFAVEKALAHLRAAGAARPLDLKELRALADRLRRKFKLLEAADTYTRILQEDPSDIDMRHKLVLSLEKKVDPEVLVPHYRAIVEQALARGDLAQAKSCLVKLLDIDPDDIDAHFRFSLLHNASNKPKEAIDSARALLTAAQHRRAFSDAARYIPRILEEIPGDVTLRQECAEILVLAGQDEDAIPLLVEVLEEIATKGDVTRIKRAYDQLASLDAKAASRFRSCGVRPPKRRPPYRRIACIAAGFILTATAAWFLIDPVRAYLGYRQARAAAAERIAAGDEAGARAALEAARLRFPGQITEEAVAEELARLVRESNAEAPSGDPESTRAPAPGGPIDVPTLIAKAAVSESRGDWMTAITIYDRLAAGRLEPAQQEIVDKNRRRLARAIDEADALARTARGAEARGAYDEAWRGYMDLVRRYPQAPVASNVRIPIAIDASPAGATILVDGCEVRTSGNVVRALPSQRLRVTVTHPTFQPEERQVSVSEGPRIEIRLLKEIAWKFDALGPIEAPPYVHQGRVFVGSRSGNIFAVDPANGTRVWGFRIEGLGDVTGAVRHHRGAVYAGSFDQSLYILRRADGEKIAQVSLPEGAAIKVTPSEPSANGIVAVAAADGNVYGIDLGKAAIVWKQPAPGATAPLLWNGRILFGDADGTLRALDADRGEPAWSAKLRGSFQHEIVARGDACFTGSDAGIVWAIDAGDGRARWERDLASTIAAAPVLDPEGDRLYVATSDGRLHALETGNGLVRWSTDLGHPITGGPAAFRSCVYAGASDHVVAIDGWTGAIRWERSVGGIIHAPLRTSGGILYAGCDDHHLYAFSLTER